MGRQNHTLQSLAMSSPLPLDPDPLSITTACPPHYLENCNSAESLGGGDSCLYKTGTNRTVTYFVTKESFFLLMECAIFKSCLPAASA